MVDAQAGSATRDGKTKINGAKQVLVEGKDETRLLSALAHHLGLTDIEFKDYGGESQLRSYLQTFIQLSNFNSVRSLAVVMDADFIVGSAEDTIRYALSNVQLPMPSAPLSSATDPQRNLQVSYLVLPHWKAQGMLEDVCLEAAKSEPAMACVDQFIECVAKSNVGWPSQNIEAKARVYAFLSAQDRPGLRLGEAAEKKLWNFDAEAFQPLRDILTGL